jgi:transcriptional regulator with XRE-family HTH domain
MPDSFGARLRERREQQQVALSTIAEQTKIKVSLLEALERDDVSHWPSGIFRRAFIRAYALAIGLDPDATVREFLDLYPDPIEAVSPMLVAASAVDGGRVAEGAQTRLRFLVTSAIGSVARLRIKPAQRPELNAKPPVAAALVVDRRPLEDLPAAEIASESAPASVPMPILEPSVLAVAEPAVPPMPTFPMPMPQVEEAPVAVAPPPPPEALAHPIAETPAAPVETPDPDLLVVAEICTELARVQTTADVSRLLHHMARVLDAAGLVLWMWDPIANELMPTLAHGYSDRVVAQLPRVHRDSNNATAAAFCAAETCIVSGDEVDNGALAVPLIGPDGCAGVLAIELADRREEKESVRAHAMIFAAQLSTLLGTAQPAEASGRLFA